MRYIGKLLDGAEVEWKKLGEVAEYEQPAKYLVRSTRYNDRFKTPVLTAGKTFILGYTDETDGIYRASESPVIIFDDFTGANKWVDFDFKAKSSAMKMITSKNETFVLLRYIYFWLNTLPSELIEGDHKRLWIHTFSNKVIPIPPLSVQQEIVRILDRFTKIEEELEQELEGRRKQLEYYREQLLSFNMLNRGGYALNNVKTKALGEIITLEKGKQLNKSLLTEKGKYPAYNGGVTYSGFTDRYNYSENKTIISQGGASAGFVNFITTKFYANAHCYVVLPHINQKVDNKYVYHFLKMNQGKLMGKQLGAGIPALHTTEILGLLIPLPPLSEQKRIVNMLDRFEKLACSMEEGLPKEIELRRKQYEYYREELLNFPQKRNETYQ